MNPGNWQVASAVFSEVTEDGFIGIQVDSFGEQNSGTAPFEALHPLGFISRPQDPDENGAASVLLHWDGADGFTFAVTDPRAAALIPTMRKGSAAMYAVVDDFELKSFTVHDGATGTKTTYVEYLDGGEKKAHRVTVGVDSNGAPICEFVHGDGAGLVVFDGKCVTRSPSGAVYAEISDEGMSVNGNLKVNGSILSASDVVAQGEVVWNAGPTQGTGSGHIHPTSMGPSSPATPGT